MGNTNKSMTSNELQLLAESLKLPFERVKNIYDNFESLDRDKKGYVSKADIMAKIKTDSTKDEFFYNRILEQFEDTPNSDQIDFEQLLSQVHGFSSNKSKTKIRFLFDFLDKKKKGLIGLEELKDCFKLVKLKTLTDKDINEIAYQTLAYADKDGDGYLNFEEFTEFYNHVLKMSI